MPTLDDALRRKLENDLAREVGKLNSRTRRELLGLIGNPPSLDRLTDDVWRSILLDFEKVLTPQLEQAFIASADHIASSFGQFAIDFDLINENAVNLARQIASEQATTMVQYRRNKMHDWIADFFENKIDRDKLIDNVALLYGPAKAEQIAVTEITRVAVEGERPVIDALINDGVMMRKRYQTARDSRVCPICGPLDGVLANGIGFDAVFVNPINGMTFSNPPLHTKCRCGVGYEYENDLV